MTELERERADLGKAEADIVAGEARVTSQGLLVEEERAAGNPTNLSDGYCKSSKAPWFNGSSTGGSF